MKVISGGQVGVDIAALRAAHALGIETGGFMPRGFRTLAGNRSEYAEIYGIVELPGPSYPARTTRNVRESDATLRIAHDFSSPGELRTLSACASLQKPILDVSATNQGGEWLFFPHLPHSPIDRRAAVVDWLIANNVETLNVAGNSYDALEEPVEAWLGRVFATWKERSS